MSIDENRVVSRCAKGVPTVHVELFEDEWQRIKASEAKSNHLDEISNYLISIWPLPFDFNDPYTKSKFTEYAKNIIGILKWESGTSKTLSAAQFARIKEFELLEKFKAEPIQAQGGEL